MRTLAVEALHLPPEILKALREAQEALLLTEHGRPLARILPYSTQEDNPLKDSILFETDLVSPIDERWEAER